MLIEVLCEIPQHKAAQSRDFIPVPSILLSDAMIRTFTHGCLECMTCPRHDRQTPSIGIVEQDLFHACRWPLLFDLSNPIAKISGQPVDHVGLVEQDLLEPLFKGIVVAVGREAPNHEAGQSRDLIPISSILSSLRSRENVEKVNDSIQGARGWDCQVVLELVLCEDMLQSDLDKSGIHSSASFNCRSPSITGLVFAHTKNVS